MGGKEKRNLLQGEFLFLNDINKKRNEHPFSVQGYCLAQEFIG